MSCRFETRELTSQLLCSERDTLPQVEEFSQELRWLESDLHYLVVDSAQPFIT